MGDLILSDGFILPRRCWFMTQSDRPHDLHEIATFVVTCGSDHGPFVALFTDEDLVEKYVEKHGLAGKVFWFDAPDLRRFGYILGVLTDAGNNTVGIDPGAASVRHAPIRELLAVIRTAISYEESNLPGTPDG